MNKSDIVLLQKSLRETVSPSITVDGVNGNQTSIAVELYRTTFGLASVEEAYGYLLKYAQIRFVSDDAFNQAATLLTVPESYVRAIAEVESRGASFLNDGRVKILFERHWFYKKLKEALDTKKDTRENIAIKFKVALTTSSADLFALILKSYSDICNTSPGGYLGNSAEWKRLELAMDLDVEAACQSTSYGGYQIMGFNCLVCGYKTAAEMAVAFAESESVQFLSLVKFIKGNPNMLTALRKGNWAGFAEAYNGKDYAKNKYDEKLAAAVAKWSNVDKK